MDQPLANVSPESNWPGEREPSGHDVEIANELPEPAFLSGFKSCLLSSPEAVDNESLMHLDLHVRRNSFEDSPVALWLTWLLVECTQKIHLPTNAAIRVSPAASA